ncbi:hypothetical protein [Rhodococcus sp. IEGM 1408]|uniref:hypothetical protein n=1 Tax=Rhodococcus sp. IEGM 1408 TaxID=3082220 RepID=UPI00295501EB|nr:hypothetical protein [Rhodococcus sp. IEGM 1408]MDV8002835.1 hypothetical protein [Rhodococcus sp. IEGM 1408]
MALAKTDSRSQTARARARQAMAVELERARKRESKLVAVFSAIDSREEERRHWGPRSLSSGTSALPRVIWPR